MLREWTATGYVTRDYRSLASEHVFPAPAMIAQPEPEVQAAAVQPAAAAASSCLVSIQHATLQELAAVPGLNRKLAAEIIKARPYSVLDQLLRVRGIGDKTLRKLRSVLTV